MTDILTPELELQIIKLQLDLKRIARQQQIKEESRKLRIAEEQTGQGWRFVPFQGDGFHQQPESKREKPGTTTAPQERGIGRPEAFYWWTLAMGAVLGAILVYVVMR